jgi:geranylgeranyl diphosphate synthase type II
MRILDEKRKLIDEEISKNLPKKEPKELYELMRDYPFRGGKRLRPILCILSCEAFGGEPKKALTTAVAVEMIHEFGLVHDDIEDGSDYRRGHPTLHRLYGIPLALNAGDALHLKAWEVLFKNKEVLGEEKTFELLKECIMAGWELVEGQTLELSWVKNKKWDMTEEDYFKMCAKKTSWYTCITPLRMGAIVANAKPECLKSLIEFGFNLGIAFQIQDDVLNLLGEEKKYGKEIGGDLYEGKRTLMLIHLMRTCKPQEKSKIIRIMDKERYERTVEEVKYIINLMKKYGSIQYAKKKATMLLEIAKKIYREKIENHLLEEPKKILEALIQFIIERSF